MLTTVEALSLVWLRKNTTKGSDREQKKPSLGNKKAGEKWGGMGKRGGGLGVACRGSD